MDTLERLLDKFEESLHPFNMSNSFQIGITLKVLEYYLDDLDGDYFELAQRCYDLQQKILRIGENDKWKNKKSKQSK